MDQQSTEGATSATFQHGALRVTITGPDAAQIEEAHVEVKWFGHRGGVEPTQIRRAIGGRFNKGVDSAASHTWHNAATADAKFEVTIHD